MKHLPAPLGHGLARTWLPLVLALIFAQSAKAQLERITPETLGMSRQRLGRIKAVVNEGIRRGEMPGAVVLVGRRGKVVFVRAFGHRALEPEPVAMTIDTVFDLASLTKPVATATSVMQLVEQGRVELSAPLAKYIPEFGVNGKEAVTVFELLTHQGGLLPDNSIDDYDQGKQIAFERIHALGLRANPGERFIYTDVGFLALGELVERISEKPLDQYVREQIFAPLGMRDTGFLPRASLRRRSAPTEKRGESWMRGDVHDPRAWRLGGVAGHAGLFSTADDLAIYAATLLAGGKRGEESILSPESVNNMTRGRRIADGNRRALGWDSQSRYSSNRGDLLSRRAFGHGGFTGTAMWIDPELELFVIFLSNRLHPDGEGSINRLAGRVATIAAASIQDVSASPLPSRESSSVLCGIDVLKRDGFAPLAGKRVGLITNHTGLDLDGRSAVELLHEAPEVDLRVLFSPEHGFAGKLDQSIIGNEQDAETGLEIVSLYGESRTPPAESLTDLDALVFDIQDIGARFYTYISTMQNSMRAAAEHGASFYVLDRPNPIGGLEVAGPVLDEGLESFVGPHRIAVRHGMTVGELALMFREELEIDVDLHVIRVEGWQRDEYYDATGLTWVNPSPNMRNLHQAVLYPGIGLLETTNLSVGRGTDTPFELFGAPWIQPRELARELNERGLPGVRFVPVRFTPDSSKFKDEECGGVNLIVTERARLRPVRTGIEIAAVLRQLYPDDWETERLNRLLCDQQVFESIVAGESPDSIEAGYGPELRDFRRRRNGFLLY